MEMTLELFDSIISTSQDRVFWKDKERRFLGVTPFFTKTLKVNDLYFVGEDGKMRAVKRSLRIWQDAECAVMYYLSDILADAAE